MVNDGSGLFEMVLDIHRKVIETGVEKLENLRKVGLTIHATCLLKATRYVQKGTPSKAARRANLEEMCRLRDRAGWMPLADFFKTLLEFPFLPRLIDIEMRIGLHLRLGSAHGPISTVPHVL